MEFDRKLLDAYYRGECTEAQKREVENLLDMEDYADYQVLTSASQKKSIWKKVKANTIGRHSTLTYKIAAAALLLCCLAFVAIRYQAADTAQEMLIVTTAKGQRAKVLLPDSSLVYLKPQSTLTYGKTFADGRHVQLLGEAFFEVQKDPEHPFTITGDRTETKVLGTSFNLQSRNHQQSLTVLTGKVAYRDLATGQTEIVMPDERVELGVANKLSKQRVSAESYTTWTKDELRFDDMPLGDMIPQLEEWYGVSIKLANRQLAKKTFTGRFHDPSINALLHSVGFALKFDYRIQDSTVTLTAQ